MKQISNIVIIILVVASGFILYDNYKSKQGYKKLVAEHTELKKEYASFTEEQDKKDKLFKEHEKEQEKIREALTNDIKELKKDKVAIVAKYEKKIKDIQTKLPHELVRQWNDALGETLVYYTQSGQFCTTITGARITLTIFTKKDELEELCNTNNLQIGKLEDTIKSYKLTDMEKDGIIKLRDDKIAKLEELNSSCENVVQESVKQTKKEYLKGLLHGGGVVLIIITIISVLH